MNDFQLKLILSVLGGVVFSFVFILLAFSLPIHDKKIQKIIAKNKLEEISQSFKK